MTSDAKKKQDATAGPGADTAGRIVRALQWPGLLGWLGSIFILVSLWFIVSSFVLASGASRLEQEKGSVDARAIVQSARWFGFGDRFVDPLLPRPVRRKKGPTPPRELPAELAPGDIPRAILALRANARASGVFGVFALVIVAFLWGLRLFDPLVKADATGADSPGK